MVLTSSLSYSSASVCTTIVAAADCDDAADADEDDDDVDDGEDVEDIPSSTIPPPIVTTVPCCTPSVEDCVKNSIVRAALVNPSPAPNNVGISGSHCLRASNIFSKKTKQTKLLFT